MNNEPTQGRLHGRLRCEKVRQKLEGCPLVAHEVDPVAQEFLYHVEHSLEQTETARFTSMVASCRIVNNVATSGFSRLFRSEISSVTLRL